MEIFIIQESSVGEDAEDVTEYRAHVPADEIERRRGCINYGAVSNVSMAPEDFRTFLRDGKVSFQLDAIHNGAYRFREYDSMTFPEDAVTLVVDTNTGLLDLSPLAWEFFPAERFLYSVPFRSEYRNGGQS